MTFPQKCPVAFQLIIGLAVYSTVQNPKASLPRQILSPIGIGTECTYIKIFVQLKKLKKSGGQIRHITVNQGLLLICQYIAADICDITKLQGSVFTFFVMDLTLKTFIFIPQSADVTKSNINKSPNFIRTKDRHRITYVLVSQIGKH